MKEFALKILAVTIAAVMICIAVFSVSAETVYYSNGYAVSDVGDNEVAIIGWDDRSENLIIPFTVLGDYVTEIGDMALLNDTFITSVDFSRAYAIDKIGVMAFKGCTGLSGELFIPAGLSYIGVGAFQECSSVERVVYHARCNIPPQCFYKCSSLLNVSINDGVASIGRYAFADCPLLEYVRIPKTVTSIDSTAFQNSGNVVIYCYNDSYAHSYAEENGIEYVLIDAPAPTEPTVPTEPTAVTEATTATEATVPTETAATEPATTAPAGYILGDVDKSDNVDVVDATFAQRYVTHADIPEDILDEIVLRGDVDGNGELEVTDVTHLMRHIIRIKTPYPIGEPVT